MKKHLKRIIVFLTATCLMLLMLVGCGDDGFDEYTIVIDGGGDIGHFNTTASQVKSQVNPFPYNTLEELAKEWMKENPKYKVIINNNSYGGSITSLRPLLNAGTAPDVIYQNGTVLEEDLGKGWYVGLNKYLNKKNPYAPEYEKWLDLWDTREYTIATDGDRYYLNLERLPIGIIYNEDLIKQAGYVDSKGDILPLETYSQLKAAQKKVQEYADANPSKGVKTFLTPYRWYDIILETNLFGYIIDGCDLNKDGKIDTEELCRAYEKGYWNVDSDLFELYLQIIKDRCEYFPANYNQYVPLTEFVNGKCAFIEGLGGTLRQISANSSVNFNYAITSYQTISKEDIATAGLNTDALDDISSVRRGTAGYGTSWWLTNTASKKGEKFVDACIDFLMYLTSPKQNNRMIGDLKGGIPLNPESVESVTNYLQPLLKLYLEDSKDEAKLGWGAVNSWNCFGPGYSSYFLNASYGYIDGSRNLTTLLSGLNSQVKGLVPQFILENEYDTSKW